MGCDNYIFFEKKAPAVRIRREKARFSEFAGA
jgi:hypothetical protein